VVEDIVDTGTTVVCLLDYLAKDNPASFLRSQPMMFGRGRGVWLA
jgi:hypoxanthine-guanine phosphoribosyltransferase